MTEESYTDDADVSQLEQRIDELEATIRKMLPSRREAIGMGVAGLAGASLMSGTASAGSAQVGTIGDSNNLVDVEAEDVNVSDTINGASVSGAANGEALTSDGAGGLTFAAVGGGIPPAFTYVDKQSQRSLNTVFTNNTGKALYVIVTANGGIDVLRKSLTAFVDGQQIKKNRPQMSSGGDLDTNYHISIDFFVPNGSTYEVQDLFIDTIVGWFEAEM